MDHHWQQHPQPPQQQYSDASASPRRHNGHNQAPRDYADHPPQGHQSASAYKYDQYHSSASAATSITSSASVSSPPGGTHNPQLRDGNGDVPMHDAQDPHLGLKSYPMRPHNQQRPSGSRTGSLNSPQEQSSAGQRYSPMETLSPTLPYAPRTAQFGNMPQTHSPSRQGEYPPGSYFPTSRPVNINQQLPSMSSNYDGYPAQTVAHLDEALASNAKAPQARVNPSLPKPVPEFKKVRSSTELHPKNSAQPPFRRANPEGGFISVSSKF